MHSEQNARQKIDKQLEQAGWIVQNISTFNLGASLGVAVREFSLETGHADYLLFVDRKAVGVIEAKPEGTTLSGVAEQSGKYLVGLPESIPHVDTPLPFAYESTGTETLFRDIGAGETIRRKLLAECDVHTLLRLPTGIFYAQGVKANVLFFDKKPASEKPRTEKLWVYDLRTNKHFTLKENQLQDKDLEDFIRCYNPENRYEREETERFKVFSYDELIKRDKVSLDIFWLRDKSLEESENLPEPDLLVKEIVENLEVALEQFEDIKKNLE